jgi:hypothetical protein
VLDVAIVADSLDGLSMARPDRAGEFKPGVRQCIESQAIGGSTCEN